MAWRIHHAVEESALRHPATRDGNREDWLDKQRLLLADMAIHLLQTALKPGTIELDKLRQNLHAVLTISDRFLPEAGLKDATGKLHGDARSTQP
jgi:hypothetical protein